MGVCEGAAGHDVREDEPRDPLPAQRPQGFRPAPGPGPLPEEARVPLLGRHPPPCEPVAATAATRYELHSGRRRDFLRPFAQFICSFGSRLSSRLCCYRLLCRTFLLTQSRFYRTPALSFSASVSLLYWTSYSNHSAYIYAVMHIPQSSMHSWLFYCALLYATSQYSITNKLVITDKFPLSPVKTNMYHLEYHYMLGLSNASIFHILINYICKSKCYFPISRCNIHIYSYMYSYISYILPYWYVVNKYVVLSIHYSKMLYCTLKFHQTESEFRAP